MGVRPICPNSHTLERHVAADGDYECDICAANLPRSCCFFGCSPCDYSLCSSCYVKLATGTLNTAPTQDGTQVPTWPPEQTTVDPDVADLCDYFSIEDRIMMKLDEAMKTRQSTFVSDIEKLWEKLEGARSPAGMLMSSIHQMHEGTFVGKVEPSGDVKRVIEKFRLDEDARTKLADFICKRPNTAADDLWEIERRLENSGKPSAVVMTMIVALQKGSKLPDLYRFAPHRDYGEVGKTHPSRTVSKRDSSHNDRDHDRHREKDRDRNRDRGERGERERERKRSRSREGRRHS